MRYRVTHITKFDAADRVAIGMNYVYLTPRSTPFQTCEHSRIITRPPGTTTDRRVDYYGNIAHFLSFERGYNHLEIRATSRVEVHPREMPALTNSQPWDQIVSEISREPCPFDFQVREMQAASPRVNDYDEAVLKYAKRFFPEGRPVLVCLADLLKNFSDDFTFDPHATTVNTPTDEVLVNKRGVCQDFSHLMIALCRAVELPARYVSGYLRTHPPKGKPRLRGADASHAWLSVFCGPLGWVDVDPTNNIFVSSDHITVAWGRDYSDVAPVKGVVIGSGSHALDVSVDVEPISELGTTREEAALLN